MTARDLAKTLIPAIVPVKDLSEVKTRLASALDANQRRQLVLAMLSDLLHALRQCRIVGRILLVSRDPSVAELAHSLDTDLLNSREDNGLNSAIDAALSELIDRGETQALVLHADLPLASADGLAKLIEEGRHADLALVPCNDKDGSNALLTRLPPRINFHYGPGSYQQHLAEAHKQGLEVAQPDLPELALDIDTVADLGQLCRILLAETHDSAHYTDQFLRSTGLLNKLLQEGLAPVPVSKIRA